MLALRLFSLLIIMVVHVTSEIRPLPSWINIDDETCSKVQAASVRNAFSQMVDIAEAAYSRTTAARTGQLPRLNSLLILWTFNIYFSLTQAVGARGRLTSVIGRRFWMTVFGIMQLTSQFQGISMISGI